MFEELIGKNVSVSMLFSSYVGDGGSAPTSYTGTLLSVKDNFLKLQVSSYNIAYTGPTRGLASWAASTATQKTTINNIMYLNMNSISSIKIEN